MLITPYYKEQCQILHKEKAEFGTHNARDIGTILYLASIMNTTDILDYGCGKSVIAKLIPFPIKEYDPGIPGKEHGNVPSYFVICHDVLEHIEPDCLKDVLADLYRCTLRYALVTISTSESPDIMPDGRNAHLIIQPWEWWKPHIESLFHVEVRCNYIKPNGKSEFAMLVIPRKDI
jgi:hypothetical protein